MQSIRHIQAQLQSTLTPRLWQGFDLLTQPSKEIDDLSTRSQARFLSAIILFILGVILVLFINPDERVLSTGRNSNLILIAAGLLMVGFYISSRTRYYHQTAIATITTLIITILAVFNLTTSGIVYAYLSLVILVASVLLDIRWLIGTIVATCVGTAALIFDHPDTAYSLDPFVFMVIASATVVVTSLYRNRQEFKRTETLVDREARLHLILEQMPALLWTTDENLMVTSSTGSGFNQISIDADSLIGTWIASAPPMEKLSMFRTEAHYQALEGKSGTYESQWGDVSFQCFIEPLYDGKHQIVGCVGVALDVTARRDAEQVAIDLRVEKERVQVLSNFIHNASHDLSTPLSVINANIYLLRNTHEPDKQHRHLDTLSQQTDRLNELVKSMLTMLRLDNLDSFNKMPIKLNNLLGMLPHNYETDIKIKRLKVVKDFDPTLPEIEANETYLGQALQEVIHNAIQFTNVGGTITLRTRQDGARVLIEVTDNGIGIAPEDQIRIFERFYRVDKARSASTGGTGLGLAIAKRVIDGHMGRIHVQSDPGNGTTIRIYLPIEPELYAAMHN